MADVKLGSNISLLRAQRSLAKATTELSSVYERLSSGQRINKASDDPAALAVSTSLTTDARVFTQAIRNVNDGVSALNIAEAALEQLSAISIRQKELAAQAANGSYSTEQRRAMNTEANALVDEFNRIIHTTEFNGIHLTDKSISELSIQAGEGADGSLAFKITEELARTVGTGSFGAMTSFVTGTSPRSVSLGDVNRDGILDMVTADASFDNTSVFIGNGDGTFKARASFSTGAVPIFVTLGDLSGDGILDIVTTDVNALGVSVVVGNGDGTFKARASFATGSSPWSVSLADVSGDGHLDIVTVDFADNKASVLIGNGDGTFKARASFTTGGAPRAVSVGDLNGDGFTDLLTADSMAGVSVLIGNGDGTFKARTSFTAGANPYAVTPGDVNGDGFLDLVTADRTNSTASVLIGNGDGTFKTRVSFTAGRNPWLVRLGDITGDGLLDMVTADYGGNAASAFIGNGDGTFKARTSFTTGNAPRSIGLGDVNGDGVLDMATAGAAACVLLSRTQEVTTSARLDLYTQQSALDAMNTIDATLERISSELGAVGTSQSRFSVALNTLASFRENFTAAFGRIMDADVAEESAKLVRTQILQQAATAILAQANQQPALVMQLLQGA